MPERTNAVKQSDRQVYLDFLRIVAVFFVIFTHTNTQGLFLFTLYPPESKKFWVYLFFAIMSRAHVPLFFMISGALLLGRTDESLGALWKNRIAKMVIILIVFSVFYYVSDKMKAGKALDWSEMLYKLYTDHTKYHLWYLYAYIAFLICLPFIRAMAKGLDSKQFNYLVCVYVFFFGVVPILQYWLSKGSVVMNEDLNPTWLSTRYIIYPCVGYHLASQGKSGEYKVRLSFLWLICVLGAALSCYMTYYKIQVTGILEPTKLRTFFDSFVVIECAAIFLSAQRLEKKTEIPAAVKKGISVVGRSTFGIYLFHVWVKSWTVSKHFLTMLRTSGMNDMLAILLHCLAVMIVSCLITLVLSKIPVLKKLVGY